MGNGCARKRGVACTIKEGGLGDTFTKEINREKKPALSLTKKGSWGGGNRIFLGGA